MKQITIVLFLLCLSNNALSQVYGDIFMDKRKVTKDIDYTVYCSKPGIIVFNISVNNDGKVTSCSVNTSKTTVTVTGAMVAGKNKIMSDLYFEKGGKYPKFHQGQVQLTTVQEKEKGPDKFAPPPN